jgi:YD repeat-containing protein
LAFDSGHSRSGDYRLFLQRVNNPCGATALACGGPIPGAIEPVGDIDTYLLQEVSLADSVTVRMVTTSGTLVPFLELYDGSGTRIAAGGSFTHRLDTAAPYTLLAQDSGNRRSGEYRLTMQRPNRPCDTTPITMSQTTSGSIDGAAEIDAYSFSAAAECLTICLVQISGSLSPSMDLYDSSGNRLAGSSSQIQQCLNPAGTFHLLVRDLRGDGTGSYRLRLESGTLSCTTVDLRDPTVTVTAPNGGEIVDAGATFQIAWTSTDNTQVTSHEIRLSTDGGGSFPTVIAADLAGTTRAFDWPVPLGLASPRARIRVLARDAAGNTGRDDSNADFVVVELASTKRVTYSYDELNRLTGAEYEGGARITYEYDAAGNRTKQVILGPLGSGLILSGPTPGEAGVVNTVEVSGATPGATVFVGYGFQPGSTSIPGCPTEVTADILNPQLAGSAVADAEGQARLSAMAPPAASGQTVLIQAVERAQCTVSNLITHTFP